MQDSQKRNGASGKGVASALISNLNALARVLRPVVTPERLLGWSLGIVYLWFGALKLAHLSPVLELIRRTSPLLATAPFFNVLALSELVLGAMLLAGVWKRWTAASAMMHLIGTFSVVFSSPQTAFQPSFPILTMEGEFVVKNLVLLAAAGTLWLLAGERGAYLPSVALSRPLILPERAAMTAPTENFPDIIGGEKTCGSGHPGLSTCVGHPARAAGRDARPPNLLER